MKKLFLLSLIILSTLAFSANAQTANCNCSKPDEVKSSLQAILKADRTARRDLMNLHREFVITESFDKDISPYITRMHSVDQANQAYIAQLLDNCGWPAYLSDEENEAILTVIEHADLEFQLNYAQLVKHQAIKGNIAQVDYATLEDRIRVRAGEKQLYGTQMVTKVSENTSILWPVEMAERLNVRRFAVGLPPIEQYMKFMENLSGKTFIWDKLLNVKDLF